MPDKIIRMRRSETDAMPRPVMLAIGGDSAAGKTTLTEGTPTDCLHVHGHASTEEARQLEKAIWEELKVSGGPPTRIGEIHPGERSEPLALTQLILLYHLLQTRE